MSSCTLNTEGLAPGVSVCFKKNVASTLCSLSDSLLSIRVKGLRRWCDRQLREHLLGHIGTLCSGGGCHSKPNYTSRGVSRPPPADYLLGGVLRKASYYLLGGGVPDPPPRTITFWGGEGWI